MSKPILKETSIRVLVIAILLIGALPLGLKGLKFGMDFTGGTLIEVKLEKALDASEMGTVVGVLQGRLNSYGLRDIAVKPLDKEYVAVELAEVDPRVVNEIQSLLGQQGKFEAIIDGKTALTGADIVSVVTDPQKGYGVEKAAGFTWHVPFLLSASGSEKFAATAEGKCAGGECSKVYMFIDRPESAVVLIPTALYDSEKDIPMDFDTSTQTVKLEDVVSNSLAQLVVSDSLDNDTLQKLGSFRGNYTRVIIPDNTSYDKATLEALGFAVVSKPKIEKYWIQRALNVETIVSLTESVTNGRPITNPEITGSASSDEEARKEINKLVILLKSGKLPVSVAIGSVSTISASFGSEFLKYSGLAGLVALFAVTGVVFLRYRRIKIMAPIVLTSLSEVVLILGMAALIGWQLDMPAIAGIIVVLGTGVDHQIIITDEVARGKREEEEVSFAQRIKRAFSIIFMSVSTVIFAMLPLMFLGLGSLKGFAITTILGSLLGVLITRPAYAAIVDRILSVKKQ